MGEKQEKYIIKYDRVGRDRSKANSRKSKLPCGQLGIGAGSLNVVSMGKPLLFFLEIFVVRARRGQFPIVLLWKQEN